MKNLVRVAMVLGGFVGTSALTSVLVVGCGGDDTVYPTADGGGTDATADSSVDTGTVDGDIDAGADVIVIHIPPSKLGTYVHDINVVACAKLASCCVGTNTAAFNTPGCIALFEQNPVLIPGLADQNALIGAADSGNIDFSDAGAQTCFNDIAALGCGSYTSAQILKVRNDCLGAAKGTVAAGSGSCATSPECVQPAHCNTAVDGGLCTAPLGVGTACGGATAHETQAQCGSLLLGVPAYCDTPNNFGKTGQCQAQRPLDAGCMEPVECASGICSPVTTDPILLDAGAGACSTSISFASADTCTAFALDAGHD